MNNPKNKQRNRDKLEQRLGQTGTAGTNSGTEVSPISLETHFHYIHLEKKLNYTKFLARCNQESCL